MVRHMDTEMTLMKQEGVTHSSLETEGMAYGGGQWESFIISQSCGRGNTGGGRGKTDGVFVEVSMGRNRQSRVSMFRIS